MPPIFPALANKCTAECVTSVPGQHVVATEHQPCKCAVGACRRQVQKSRMHLHGIFNMYPSHMVLQTLASQTMHLLPQAQSFSSHCHLSASPQSADMLPGRTTGLCASCYTLPAWRSRQGWNPCSLTPPAPRAMGAQQGRLVVVDHNLHTGSMWHRCFAQVHRAGAAAHFKPSTRKQSIHELRAQRSQQGTCLYG